MKKEELTKALSTIFDIDEIGDNLVIHNLFFCSSDNSEDMPLILTSHDEKYYLTDNCQTYEKLEEQGIIIDSEQNAHLLENILSYSLVSFDSESKEFYVEVTDPSQIASTACRLLQTIIIAGSIDLFVR